MSKSSVAHCPAFGEFLKQLNSEGTPEAKEARLDKFVACAQQQGIPLIEEGTRPGFGRAIFLYRGSATKVILAGDMTGWLLDESFVRVPGTDFFYLSREFEVDARLDYKFVLDDKVWVLDPLNSRTMMSGFGSNSQFWMPKYVPPTEIEFNPAIPHGTVEDLCFASAILKNTRTVKIYLPPGYPEPRRKYLTLYVHDGTDYLKFAEINNIADNLIHERAIPPFLMVMVPPVDRTKEYAANPDFARALATELVPLVDGRYHTDAEAKSRTMLGSSLGGLVAAYITAVYPNVFGSFAGQSSAFIVDTPLELLQSLEAHSIRIHLDVGTYEENVSHLNILAGNRRLRDLLVAKAYPLQYIEVHEGHSWGSWRARIPSALKFLWGDQSALRPPPQ